MIDITVNKLDRQIVSAYLPSIVDDVFTMWRVILKGPKCALYGAALLLQSVWSGLDVAYFGRQHQHYVHVMACGPMPRRHLHSVASLTVHAGNCWLPHRLDPSIGLLDLCDK